MAGMICLSAATESMMWAIFVPIISGLPTDAERPRLYHNNHDGTFTDVTRSKRLERVLHAMGANFGDLDNDGFLDFYLGTGNPDLATIVPNRMFRNDKASVSRT